jgi:hypothetical protein
VTGLGTVRAGAVLTRGGATGSGAGFGLAAATGFGAGADLAAGVGGAGGRGCGAAFGCGGRGLGACTGGGGSTIGNGLGGSTGGLGGSGFCGGNRVTTTGGFGFWIGAGVCASQLRPCQASQCSRAEITKTTSSRPSIEGGPPIGIGRPGSVAEWLSREFIFLYIVPDFMQTGIRLRHASA